MRRLLVATLLLLASATSADTLTGRVVGVSDGDTITVLDGQLQQHKVRLAGIDAPESRQAFGTRAKAALSLLVFGRGVEVTWSKVDRYGRIVGRVHAGGADANRAMLEQGMAWHYRANAKEQPAAERAGDAEAEEGARAARRGLWADAEPVPPWEWRAASRNRTN